MAPHGELRLYVSPDRILLEPAAGAGPALVIDRSTERITTAGAFLLVIYDGLAAMRKGPPQTVYAVFGVASLLAGGYLILVTRREHAATLRGAKIWAVKGTVILPLRAGPSVPALTSAERRDEHRYLRLLTSAMREPGLYFSAEVDLTLTAQRAAAAAADPAIAGRPAWARSDARHFWNRFLSQPLIDAAADAYVVPFIRGFVQQIARLSLSGRPADIVLLARRGAIRAGTRFHSRGVDAATGAVSNWVETEQVLVVDAGGGAATICAHVQVRGSVPLLWAQPPTLKYTPKAVMGDPAASTAACGRHLGLAMKAYGALTAVSLVNAKKWEGRLGTLYAESVAAVSSSQGLGPDRLRLIWFDFHKECGSSKYHNLSKLMADLGPGLESAAFFRATVPTVGSASTAQTQGGVVRTNCIDCLDRTNVVQGMLGRAVLEAQLRALAGAPSSSRDVSSSRDASSSTLAAAFPGIEPHYKALWADHGDALSLQYAGTGALKSDFTRTGKRSLGGAMQDGRKAVVRYWRNNFSDGSRQDGLALVTGAYQPLRSHPSPFGRRGWVASILAVPFPLYGLIRAVAVAAALVTFLGALISAVAAGVPLAAWRRGGLDGGDVAGLLRPALPWAAIGWAAHVFLAAYGRELADHPRLV